jgi:hypothetical protein
MLLQGSDRISLPGMKAVCSLWLMSLVVIVVLFVIYVAVSCCSHALVRVFQRLPVCDLFGVDLCGLLLAGRRSHATVTAVISAPSENRVYPDFWPEEQAQRAVLDGQHGRDCTSETPSPVRWCARYSQVTTDCSGAAA